MKKIFKNPIITFILGLIIATTITVSASIIYQASEIGFTPSDSNWNVNNLEDALNDLYENKSITPVLLWTNENPNSAFGAQTISLDLSSYKYVLINATYGGNGIRNDYITNHKSIIAVGDTSVITGTNEVKYASSTREVTVTTTGVVFANGRVYKGSNLESGNYAVPLNIWGLK